jgi:serine/threonine-protein kinase
MPSTELEPDTQPPGVSAGEHATCDFELARPGHVLERLALSMGTVTGVQLPDTAPDDTSVSATEPSSGAMPAPEERAGRYQLFGEIARGGMGAVLLGRDPDLGRDLAVKVLLENHEEKPEMLRRFVEEAQIGGQLQHPGIVPVYELGTFAEGRPYFTMKLVRGRTLSALLEERPSPVHDLPRFLSIFEAICQTVAYSHVRGVIHRDLKPSNIMVGAFGEVQVMDWGLAKVLKEGGIDERSGAQLRPDEGAVATVRSGSDVDESRAGSVLGTPAYMSPEQASGALERVDRRSDVFGLGAILCEILTGRAAYTGRSVQEVVLKAMRGETADALARLEGCGAEAELIALAKDCLAVEPDLRPREARLVAERITAYLAGVQDRLRAAEVARAAETARAEEAIVRARAERRARQFQVGLAASLLVLSTAGGLTFTYWLQVRQQRAARFAQVLAETMALRDKARREVDDPVAWRDALAALERAEEQGSPGQVLALRGEIEAGLDDAERDARLRQALVEIRGNAEDVGAGGTDHAYATAFRDAKLDLDALAPDEFARRLLSRRAAVVIEVSTFFDDWSGARRRAGRPAAARRRPVEAARLADPDPYRDRLRQALLAPDIRREVGGLIALAAAPAAADLPAPTAVLLGRTLTDNGEPKAAVALLRAAASRHPGDVWVNQTLALALVSLDPPARDEALRYYTAARTLHPETGHELAHLLEQMNRGAEAEAVWRDLVVRRPEHAGHLSCLGKHLIRTGRSGEGARIHERAVAAARAALRLRPDDPELRIYLAASLNSLGRADEAIAEFRELIRLNPDNAEAHINIGDALSNAKKDYAAAEAEHRVAIRLKPDSARAHNNLAIVLARQGKADQAIAEFRESIRLKPTSVSATTSSCMVPIPKALQCCARRRNWASRRRSRAPPRRHGLPGPNADRWIRSRCAAEVKRPRLRDLTRRRRRGVRVWRWAIQRRSWQSARIAPKRPEVGTSLVRLRRLLKLWKKRSLNYAPKFRPRPMTAGSTRITEECSDISVATTRRLRHAATRLS